MIFGVISKGFCHGEILVRKGKVQLKMMGILIRLGAWLFNNGITYSNGSIKHRK